MKRRGIGSHTRPNHGASVEWQTPPEILAALGPFDDDPAKAGQRDGLDREWRGFVWLNPPYGATMWPWLAKLAEHGQGIALLFARTETRGFFSEVWGKASALLFLRGRPHFYKNGQRASGNSGGPVVLVAYGHKASHRLERSAHLGAFVSLKSLDVLRDAARAEQREADAKFVESLWGGVYREIAAAIRAQGGER